MNDWTHSFRPTLRSTAWLRAYTVMTPVQLDKCSAVTYWFESSLDQWCGTTLNMSQPVNGSRFLPFPIVCLREWKGQSACELTSFKKQQHISQSSRDQWEIMNLHKGGVCGRKSASPSHSVLVELTGSYSVSAMKNSQVHGAPECGISFLGSIL
jgi:hypothetical protein